MAKLNQIVAVEKGIKQRVYSEFSALHKKVQKEDLFTGVSKTYRKLNEEDEDYPAQRKKVKETVVDVLDQTASLLTELYDVTASKDYSNCVAHADVVVDGQVIIDKAPTPFLLFMEKQLSDLKTHLAKLPTLDDAEDWTEDPSTRLYKTQPSSTHRTKKIEKPIVLYDATDHHPAQTQLLSEDRVVGYWDTISFSGALPQADKAEYLKRMDKLIHAVKFAREEANSTEAIQKKVGEKVFKYLLSL